MYCSTCPSSDEPGRPNDVPACFAVFQNHLVSERRHSMRCREAQFSGNETNQELAGVTRRPAVLQSGPPVQHHGNGSVADTTRIRRDEKTPNATAGSRALRRRKVPGCNPDGYCSLPLNVRIASNHGRKTTTGINGGKLFPIVALRGWSSREVKLAIGWKG